MIDRNLKIVAVERRRDLGAWSIRKLKQGVTKQGNEAKGILKRNGIDTKDIREQWGLQKQEQLSLRARESNGRPNGLC